MEEGNEEILWGKHTVITHRLGRIISRLPHQLTTKPRFYCVPTLFVYVVVKFVELIYTYIRHGTTQFVKISGTFFTLKILVLDDLHRNE